MHPMKRTVAVALSGLCFLIAPIQETRAGCDPRPPSCDRKPIDLVICLDTSGSMEPMIDSARGRLWDIVNELAKARPTPRLRVGLLTYGSPKVSTQAAGWVVKQIDLTDDLDGVYQKMMALTTDGGDEYVGWVLNDALRTMNWSKDAGALKLIFVAGNESADQAAERFNFRQVCSDARREGIVINAIYGGSRVQGMHEKWHEVAQHGGGNFSAIDMQCGTVQIETPQDKIISELNRKLNDTYIAFGRHGREKKLSQIEQDANAAKLGRQSAASRAAAKASSLYSNESWDLVDASTNKEINYAELETSELPDIMQKMTPEERKSYVEGMRAARAEIQSKIQEAQAARDEFLKRRRAEDNSGKTSLDEAILQALHEQAKEKGFTFSG